MLHPLPVARPGARGKGRHGLRAKHHHSRPREHQDRGHHWNEFHPWGIFVAGSFGGGDMIGLLR